MSDTINIVSVTSPYSSVISVCKATTQYGTDLILNYEQTRDYLVNHYASGYNSYSSFPKSTGLMPPGVKAIFSNVVVFERPPTYQNIFYIPDNVSETMSEKQYVYRVALPWQLYIAVYNSDYYLTSVYMYFMDAPLTSVDQNLYAPTIPNFYANGLLCRPNFSSMDDVERYTKDVSGIIHSAFDWVWNNGTNHDLTESMLLLPKYTKDLSSTVFGHTPESRLYFDQNNVSTNYKLSVGAVTTAFLSWEKIDLKDILNYKWVSPSSQVHDTSHIDWMSIAQESDEYSNHLQDWLFENYSDETEEDIINRMDNGDFDGAEYVNFLLNNGYISMPPTNRPESSYKDMLQCIFKENSTLRKKTINVLSDIKKITEILYTAS